MFDPGLDLLRAHVVPGALHNSKERSHLPKCHLGTRVEVMEKINVWFNDVSDPRLVLWLNGSIGLGKSVIAEAIASSCYDEGRLLGAFFASANVLAKSGPIDETNIVSTIAYQMEHNLPLRLSEPITHNLEKNPLIFELDFAAQLDKLIVEPLSLRSHEIRHHPLLIIIDGLDQLTKKHTQTQIVQELSTAVERLHNDEQILAKLLITSRSEPHIHSAFMAPRISHLMHIISLEDYPAQDDIRTYFLHRLKEFQCTHPNRLVDSWVPGDTVDHLVRRSSGRLDHVQLTFQHYLQDINSTLIRRSLHNPREAVLSLCLKFITQLKRFSAPPSSSSFHPR